MGMLAALVVAGPSQAIGGFESADGNLVSDGNTDWNDFDEWYNRIVTSTGATTSVSTDPVIGFDQLTWVQDRTGNPDDIFSGGVKQDEDCASTKVGSLGGGNSKFDLDRIYLTHTEDAGKDYLFLAWARVPQNSTTASAHIAFEFNKGTDGACNGLIKRVAGDLLIVYDFEGGSGTSSFPKLKLLEWITAGGPCEVANNAAPCWKFKSDLAATGSDGRVNTVDIGGVNDAIANETIGPVGFGEAGIDIAGAGVTDPCDFSGHVTAVSRSSGNSGTAQMKDKVGPAVFTLPGCAAEPRLVTQVAIKDYATLVGFDDTGDGDGDLTFELYGPDDEECEDDPVYETTIEGIDDAGPWSTRGGDNASGRHLVPLDAGGEYRWVVTYTGDDKNLATESLCGEEVVVVSYDFPSGGD